MKSHKFIYKKFYVYYTASASKRNKTIELPPGNYKNRWGNATPKQLEGAPANPEYNKKQVSIKNNNE